MVGRMDQKTWVDTLTLLRNKQIKCLQRKQDISDMQLREILLLLTFSLYDLGLCVVSHQTRCRSSVLRPWTCVNSNNSKDCISAGHFLMTLDIICDERHAYKLWKPNPQRIRNLFLMKFILYCSDWKRSVWNLSLGFKHCRVVVSSTHGIQNFVF